MLETLARITRIDASEQSFALSVERSVEGFAALRCEWGKLLEKSDAGIFNSWEWLYPWYRRIERDRALRIVSIRDGSGSLAGLMPLCKENKRALGYNLRRLSFLGETEVGSDYLDVITPRGREESASRAFAEYLRANHEEWDVLDLLDLDARSLTIGVLREVFGGNEFEIEISEGSVCPYETFTPGESAEGYLRRTKRYDNVVRRRKWLSRQEGYRVDVATAPNEVPAPLSEFMRLHAMRWAEDGGSQGIRSAAVEAFHRDATEYLAERGKVRLYTMYVEGKAVASVYGLVHRGGFVYYQSGRDPQWQSKSVGLVLVGETFRDSIEAGLREYDFLRGLEPYKADWVTQERRTVGVRIYMRCGAGAWLTRSERAARATKQLLKRALPGRVVDALRRRSHGG